MTAYYNEIDPYAAQWLRNLINAGHIAPGIVDERSIEDVYPSDLRGFTQCHFFAGIGVWSHALRSAGWSDDRPVWTGSCPCQPFSAAGKGAGFDDERHLWPAFFHLIRECKPAIVIGEQVASRDANAWIELVHDDVEGVGYRLGAVPFPSAGVGAPHIRDRLYWVADSYSGTRGKGSADVRGRASGGDAQPRAGLGSRGLPDRLADTSGGQHFASGAWADQRAMAGGDGALQASPRAPGPTNGLWADADWLFCRDGRWRPVEPGTFPLAHGAAARVGRLRAYGNAIVPQVAKEVIAAYMACRP